MNCKNFALIAYIALTLGSSTLQSTNFVSALFKDHTNAELSPQQKNALIGTKKTTYKAIGVAGLFGLSLNTAVKLYKKQPFAASTASKVILSATALAAAASFWKNHSLTLVPEEVAKTEAEKKAAAETEEEEIDLFADKKGDKKQAAAPQEAEQEQKPRQHTEAAKQGEAIAAEVLAGEGTWAEKLAKMAARGAAAVAKPAAQPQVPAQPQAAPAQPGQTAQPLFGGFLGLALQGAAKLQQANVAGMLPQFPRGQQAAAAAAAPRARATPRRGGTLDDTVVGMVTPEQLAAAHRAEAKAAAARQAQEEAELAAAMAASAAEATAPKRQTAQQREDAELKAAIAASQAPAAPKRATPKAPAQPTENKRR